MSVESIVYVGTRKQVTSVNPASTQLAFSPVTNCIAGNYLILTVLAATQAGSLNALSDSAGATSWNVSVGAASNRGVYIAGLFLNSPLRTTDTLTATFGSTLNVCGYCLEEFSGVGNANSDKTNTASWSATTSAATGTTVTTTQAHELWVSAMAWNVASDSINFTSVFPWNLYSGAFGATDGATFTGTAMYCIRTATGAAANSGTTGGAGTGVGAVATIKPIWTPPAGFVPSPVS